MNVSINLPHEIETKLVRRAAAAGQDVATFVREVVIDSLAEEPERSTRDSNEEFMVKLQQIIDLHPKSNWTVDDSRESIYAGRGE